MPAKRKPKTEYPQLVLKTAQVAQITGYCANEVAKLATAKLLPAFKVTEKSDWCFFLPHLFKHFGGDYSIVECLAFVSAAEDWQAHLRIVFLESEKRRLEAENLALRGRLDVARKALA